MTTFLIFIFVLIISLFLFLIGFFINDSIKTYKKKHKKELTLNKNRYGGH